MSTSDEKEKEGDKIIHMQVDEVEEEKMSGIIGNIEAYIIGDDFSLYKERLNHFLSLNKITDDKLKVDVLASFGGADLYKILYSLIQPQKVSEFRFDELIKKLSDHFEPKRNEVAESFKFNKRQQRQNESIGEYIVELKAAAETCNFGNFLDRALRDRFICGINNESIQRKLFNDSKITSFKEACDAAMVMETTKQDMEIIHNGAAHFIASNVREQHRTTQYERYNNKSNGSHQNNFNKSKSFSGHGGQRQNFSGKRTVCFNCNLPGHISKFCLRRLQSSQGEHKDKNRKVVHNLIEDNPKFDFQYINSLNSFCINRINSNALTTVTNINGIDVRMEIDTGAGGTVIQMEQFRNLFPSLK